MENEVSNPAKKQWEPMCLTYVAHVSEIVLQGPNGGGKDSIATGDNGEPLYCPPGNCPD